MKTPSVRPTLTHQISRRGCRPARLSESLIGLAAGGVLVDFFVFFFVFFFIEEKMQTGKGGGNDLSKGAGK